MLTIFVRGRQLVTCFLLFMAKHHRPHCVAGPETVLQIPAILQANGCRNPLLVGGDNAPADPDMLVSDGDVIKVAELSFKYMATPGHTKGSAIIISGDCIFSGDTIMSRTCGRTDLYGGSTKEIRVSLKKIGELEGDYKIYPGHGPETNMAVERYANPYLRKAMGLGI